MRAARSKRNGSARQDGGCLFCLKELAENYSINAFILFDRDQCKRHEAQVQKGGKRASGSVNKVFSCCLPQIGF